jgi:hypothetical protein
MVFKRGPKERDAGQGSDVTVPARKDWTDAEAALSKLARVAADQKPQAQGSDFSAGPRMGAPSLEAARMTAPSLDAAIRPADPSGLPGSERPTLRRRASRSLARFLVPACLGVVATLVWQSYGGMAKQGIGSDQQRIPVLPESAISPPFGRVINFEEPNSSDAPARAARAGSAQAAAAGATSPDATLLTAPSVPPRELQQLDTIVRDLAALRQSVEQLAAGQEQMARDIAKLQSAGQDLRRGIPAAPPPTAARKPVPPVPPAPQASAALPPPAPISPPPSAAPLPSVPSADAPPRPPLPLR